MIWSRTSLFRDSVLQKTEIPVTYKMLEKSFIYQTVILIITPETHIPEPERIIGNKITF